MTIEEVAEWEGFLDLLCRYGPDELVLFRGVQKAHFELVPSLGRLPASDPIERTEKDLLGSFRRKSEPYLTSQPENYFEWVALAQHHGVPTRLLDWSTSPLVAAFFAAGSDSEGDFAVYHMRAARFSFPAGGGFPDDHRGFLQWVDSGPTPRVAFPANLDLRMEAQAGCFTVSRNPSEALENPEIVKTVFASDLRQRVKATLLRWRFTHAAMFPGLSGVGQSIADSAWRILSERSKAQSELATELDVDLGELA